MEHFVQIGADANIGLLRRQFQRAVARHVKPPRGDDFFIDLRAHFAQDVRGPSLEPVSSTTTQSASRMDSIQRLANLDSFLQIAYTHIFHFPMQPTHGNICRKGFGRACSGAENGQPDFEDGVLRLWQEIDLDIRRVGVFIAGGRQPFQHRAAFNF